MAVTQASKDAGACADTDKPPITLPWWAFGLSLVLTSVPVLLSSGMPSWDYSMHAARASIIVRQALPLFHDAFHYKLVPLPNLAVDVLVPLLSGIMPITAANKVFVLLALLLQATGAAALTIAVQRRLTPVALLIPLSCYNIVVGWGFTGYLFSIGIGMWGFATYVMLRPRPVATRSAVLNLFGIATYFGHLAAFGLMIVSIATFEVVAFLQSEARNSKPLRAAAATVGLSLIAPLFVHVFFSPVGESVGFALAPPVLWVTDLIMSLNPYRTTGFSVLTLVLVSSLILMLVRGVVRIDPTLGWTSLFLLLVFLMTPRELYGSWLANTRLIPWVEFVFLASLRVSTSRRWALGIGAWSLALLVAQTCLILNLWLPWDRQRLDVMEASRQAPPGTMFVSMEQSGPVPPTRNFIQSVLRSAWQDDRDWQPPTSHITDEVALYGEYLPMQLTLLPGKQPLEFDSKYWDLYLRMNSSKLNEIEPINAESFLELAPDMRKRLMADLAFAPLQVNWRTVARLRSLLGTANEEYRAIRQASGVYPNAGIYIVYIHRWSPDPPNPFPDLFREVHAGQVYNVYEMKATGAGG